MASAAGGSGGGGADRCPSGEKGITPVGHRCKKLSAFHRAALRYLEKNIENVWQWARNIRLILMICYGSSPPNSEVSAPTSSSMPARNLSEYSVFPRKDVENLCDFENSRDG